MKILQVVNSMDVGGLEQMVLTLSRELLKRGHEVEIFTLDRLGALATQAEAAGIHVSSASRSTHSSRIRAVSVLRAKIRQYQPAVVNAHNIVPHLYASAASLGLPEHVSVCTRHDMAEHAHTAKGDRLFKLSGYNTDFVVSVCMAASRKFLDRRLATPEQSKVIPNGINLAKYTARSPLGKEALLAELQLRGNPLLFCTVGRLAPVKKQFLLIKALAKVVKDGVDAHLVIVGEGPSAEELRAIAASEGLTDRIHFLGQRFDIPSILAGVDVFLQSSQTEGYSLALVEAAAAGIPVVASDVGGNKEIVVEGKTGHLYPEGDLPALSERMKELALDAHRREELGAHAASWAEQFGSLDVMVDKYLQLYRTR